MKDIINNFKNKIATDGVIGVFSVMVVLGCCALNVHDSDLLHQHPPDPGHKQWPQDGDDP